MESKDKSFKSKNIFDSFSHAFEGMIYGFKTTKNLWVDLIAAVITVIMGFVFKITTTEWLSIIICVGLVMALELANTAIEEAVNLAMPKIHPVAKISKDVAAGAVLFSALISIAVGCVIFIPKIIELF